MTTYYRPSAPGGRVLAGHCVTAESIIEFGVLRLQASVIKGQKYWLVVLRLPSRKPAHVPWQTVRFATADFHIRDLSTGALSSGLPVAVLRNDEYDSVVDPYDLARPGDWLYSIDVNVSALPPERFELWLPPMVLDGHEIRYSPIVFERKIWEGISPFNC